MVCPLKYSNFFGDEYCMHTGTFFLNQLVGHRFLCEEIRRYSLHQTAFGGIRQGVGCAMASRISAEFEVNQRRPHPQHPAGLSQSTRSPLLRRWGHMKATGIREGRCGAKIKHRINASIITLPPLSLAKNTGGAIGKGGLRSTRPQVVVSGECASSV